MGTLYHRHGLKSPELTIGTCGLSDEGSGVKPTFLPVQFRFDALKSLQRARLVTSGKGLPVVPTILPALGTLRLRIYRHTPANYRYSPWYGPFVNTGDIGEHCAATLITANQWHTMELRAIPDASVADDWVEPGWLPYVTFYLGSNYSEVIFPETP